MTQQPACGPACSAAPPAPPEDSILFSSYVYCFALALVAVCCIDCGKTTKPQAGGHDDCQLGCLSPVYPPLQTRYKAISPSTLAEKMRKKTQKYCCWPMYCCCLCIGGCCCCYHWSRCGTARLVPALAALCHPRSRQHLSMLLR